MYFRDFPSFLYDFKMDGKSKTAIVKDITRNVRVKRDILANVTLYDEYDIVDGETPEILAERFYGTPEYHWIVMLTNDKFDYLSDFPLQETYLQRHIENKYNPTYYSNKWSVVGTDKKSIRYQPYKSSDGSRINFDSRYFITDVEVTIKGKFDNGQVLDFTCMASSGRLTFDNINQTITVRTDTVWNGNPVGDLTSDTKGREHDPVYFVNQLGLRVEPDPSNPEIIPVTGDVAERALNDKKRRIKVINPSLVEIILKNYEEVLK